MTTNINVKEINIEVGMLSCADAMAYLRKKIELCKSSRIQCVLIIAGYGSSGKGGIIRTKA